MTARHCCGGPDLLPKRVLYKRIVILVPHRLQNRIERLLHCVNSSDLRLVKEQGAYIGIAEVMVIKEKMKHLVYARRQPSFALLSPHRSRVSRFQFGEIQHQFPPDIGEREAAMMGIECVHDRKIGRGGTWGNVRAGASGGHLRCRWAVRRPKNPWH